MVKKRKGKSMAIKHNWNTGRVDGDLEGKFHVVKECECGAKKQYGPNMTANYTKANGNPSKKEIPECTRRLRVRGDRAPLV